MHFWIFFTRFWKISHLEHSRKIKKVSKNTKKSSKTLQNSRQLNHAPICWENIVKFTKFKEFFQKKKWFRKTIVFSNSDQGPIKTNTKIEILGTDLGLVKKSSGVKISIIDGDEEEHSVCALLENGISARVGKIKFFK